MDTNPTQGDHIAAISHFYGARDHVRRFGSEEAAREVPYNYYEYIPQRVNRNNPFVEALELCTRLITVTPSGQQVYQGDITHMGLKDLMKLSRRDFTLVRDRVRLIAEQLNPVDEEDEELDGED